MKTTFYFTGDNPQVMNRSKYLRAAILLSGLKVVKSRPPASASDNDSVWVHGLSHHPPEGVRPGLLPLMSAYKGKLVFLMNDYESGFHLEKIPSEIKRKTTLFIRNHWPSHDRLVSQEILGRTGFKTPIFQPFKLKPGLPLINRTNQIIFIGKSTGGNNLDQITNQRVKAVSLLKQSGLPFVGGLVHDESLPVPASLKVNPLSASAHAKILSDSSICLALWGNAELTYRLFEGFSRRFLVFCPSLAAIRFLDCGLTPGVHFIELKPDMSDLIEKKSWWLDHTEEAQHIAQNGFDFFKSNFSFSGLSLPDKMVSEIRTSWQGLIPENSSFVSKLLLKTCLQFTNSI